METSREPQSQDADTIGAALLSRFYTANFNLSNARLRVLQLLARSSRRGAALSRAQAECAAKRDELFAAIDELRSYARAQTPAVTGSRLN